MGPGTIAALEAPLGRIAMLPALFSAAPRTRMGQGTGSRSGIMRSPNISPPRTPILFQQNLGRSCSSPPGAASTFATAIRHAWIGDNPLLGFHADRAAGLRLLMEASAFGRPAPLGRADNPRGLLRQGRGFAQSRPIRTAQSDVQRDDLSHAETLGSLPDAKRSSRSTSNSLRIRASSPNGATILG